MVAALLPGSFRASAASPGYTVTKMTWTVHVGPSQATTCGVVGEVFVPDGASASSPQPAILTTNGFGGSYADQVPLAAYFAANQGYVVLTYSGLGFGGSGCNIELDSPQWDGQAASQLVSWLGQQPEVLRDGPDDPRVGMIGGSYGGAVQLAAASIDPRIDAIVPFITWNDLAYSLAPENNAPSLDFTDTPPGVLKFEWATLFFGDGLTGVIKNPAATPFPPSTCPGFDPAICGDLATAATLGYPDPATVAMLRSDSMVGYGSTVHAATLLMQGEADTLFNIDEAVANYNLLRANGVPTKLVIQSWGHSNNVTPAPGELGYDPANPGYENVLIEDWFARYLRHDQVSTGPPVEYFRPWVPYSGSAQPAYGNASSWPVGGVEPLYLSGPTAAETLGGAGGDLVSNPTSVVAGTAAFANPAPGSPTSYSETSAVQYMQPFAGIPPTDVPGTFVSWQTSALPQAVDSVGIPTLSFTLTAPLASSTSAATMPVVVAKLYDISPAGTMTLADRIVSPVRIPTSGQPVKITLPGVVHEYAAGDRVRLVLAATDGAYLGSRLPQPLMVSVDPAHPPVLDLPLVAASDQASGGPAPSTPPADPLAATSTTTSTTSTSTTSTTTTPTVTARPVVISPTAISPPITAGTTGLAFTGMPLIRLTLAAVAAGLLGWVIVGLAGVDPVRRRRDREAPDSAKD